MTDKEWVENLPVHDTKELMRSLKNCGRDPYYDKIYIPLVAEIERRLNLFEKSCIIGGRAVGKTHLAMEMYINSIPNKEIRLKMIELWRELNNEK